jgi:hypothetical protein
LCSEIDEEQTESRRVECMTTIKDLEIQFQKLKEELIEEKLRLVETKLQEIETETAREFQMPVNKLKENMNLRLSVSNLLRDYRLANIENTYMCDETSARQSVENDKAMLFDSIKSKIENEIREIEENRRLLYLELKKKEDYYEAMGSWTQLNNGSSSTTINNNNNTGGQPMANQNQQAISKSQTSPYKRKSQQKFPTTDDFDRKKKTTTVSDILFVAVVENFMSSKPFCLTWFVFSLTTS